MGMRVAIKGIVWEVDPTGHFEAQRPETISARELSGRLIEACGLIPFFLDAADERDARTQIDERYGFGLIGLEKARISPNGTYFYPEDPPERPYMMADVGQERVYIYPHAITAIVDRSVLTDHKFQKAFVTRVD